MRTDNDDFDFSLCYIPEKKRLFWLFHCHSYLFQSEGFFCGKPIFVEVFPDERFHFPQKKIQGRNFFDITKKVTKSGTFPCPDSVIVKTFSSFNPRTGYKNENPLFRGLLVVNNKDVIFTIKTKDALQEAFQQKAPWTHSLKKLCRKLNIKNESCGLTGSWALGCNNDTSDIDLVISIQAKSSKEFQGRVEKWNREHFGKFPDKYGLLWPLRIRAYGYEWCLFVKYLNIEECPLYNKKVIYRDRAKVIHGIITDTINGVFLPSCLEVKDQNGEKMDVVFPSTEARGVFSINDSFYATAHECYVLNGGNEKPVFVIDDGLLTCPSLKSKLTST